MRPITGFNFQHFFSFSSHLPFDCCFSSSSSFFCNKHPSFWLAGAHFKCVVIHVLFLFFLFFYWNEKMTEATIANNFLSARFFTTLFFFFCTLNSPPVISPKYCVPGADTLTLIVVLHATHGQYKIVLCM